ncbi:MAG: hypothetical protein K6G30_12895 [Acetatifactor sp.]|nr:hypothetical protein [Acetatifactor sp.]
MMQTLNYWKQFENTGKVEDYLSYAFAQQNRAEEVLKQEEDNRGANPYATVHMGHRNGIETDAYRGI